MKATARDAIAISLNAHGIAAKRFRQFVPAGTRTAREVSAVLILKGIDFACLNLRLRVSAPKGSKALSPPWIPYLFWEPIRRAAFSKRLPDALTRHNRNLSPSVHSS